MTGRRYICDVKKHVLTFTTTFVYVGHVFWQNAGLIYTPTQKIVVSTKLNFKLYVQFPILTKKKKSYRGD